MAATGAAPLARWHQSSCRQADQLYLPPPFIIIAVSAISLLFHFQFDTLQLGRPHEFRGSLTARHPPSGSMAASEQDWAALFLASVSLAGRQLGHDTRRICARPLARRPYCTSSLACWRSKNKEAISSSHN